MSVAMYMLLRPPLPVIAVVRIICGGFLFLAVAIGFGFGVEMAPHHKIFTVGLCITAGSCGIYYSCRLVKSFYISISSYGSITLALDDPALGGKSTAGEFRPLPAELMTGTTVWPGLIFLRLRLVNGRVLCIPVMRGLTDAQSYRTLAVACKWILRQNDPAQGTKS